MSASADQWDDVMASLGLEPSTPARPRRGPGSRAACGTPSGWARHRRDSEQPCDPCRQAKYAENNAARNAKRRAAGIPPRLPVEHGTRNGAWRHYRLGEPACDPCRAARAEARREQAATSPSPPRPSPLPDNSRSGA